MTLLAWIRLAFRNLLRNRRRTAYTIIAVATGFAAINLFGGFTEYIFTNLRESFIYIEANGHLAVYKSADAVDRIMLPDDDQLLTAADIAGIRDVAGRDPEVVAVAEAMNLTGLISNGKLSTIFIGAAWHPSEKLAFQELARGLVSRLTFFDGAALRDDVEQGVGIARGLARILGGGLDSPAILISSTVRGQVNAMDVTVRQLTDTPRELLEDKLVVMPLGLARALVNTDGASRVSLVLVPGANEEAARARLADQLRAKGMDLNVVVWRNLSPFYVKVEQMFRVIFSFIFLIVGAIVVMSVVNTISMAVLERTREIGTLRAMGARRTQLVALFGIEGALLGVLGCGAGLVAFAVVWGLFGLVGPEWIPPQIARTVPLEIYVVPRYLGASALFLVLLSLVSGLLPAYRTARLNIARALGHA